MADPRPMYWANVLTGGGDYALDAIDGADLSDLDGAFVVTVNVIYFYSLDADSAAAESSPDVISPDSNAGDKRWVLVGADVASLTLPNAGWVGIGAALERLEFYTAGYAAFMGCNLGVGTSPDRLLHAEKLSALTNTVQQVARLTHITSGTPANNIGVGLEFEQETSADNNEIIATIEAIVTDATPGSEDAELALSLMAGGVAVAKKLRILSSGIVHIAGQSGCGAKMSVAQVIPNNIWTKLALDTEFWDIQNEFDNTMVTGTTDATEANKLHDADGGFTSALVGATVWNTTDNTYTTVSAYVDSGELGLTDDIMVNGEGYKIYWARFTASQAGKYTISGSATIEAVDDSKTLGAVFKKNGTFFGATSFIVQGGTRDAFTSLSAVFDLAANDYIEIFIYQNCGAVRTASAYDYSNVLGIAKIA